MATAQIESLRAAISFAERGKNAELLGAFQMAVLEGQDVIDARRDINERSEFGQTPATSAVAGRIAR